VLAILRRKNSPGPESATTASFPRSETTFGRGRWSLPGMRWQSDDQERIVAERTLPLRFPCRPHHTHAASGLDDAFNDRSAGMAKLMRKFAQA
jgi:hypothetical protein